MNSLFLSAGISFLICLIITPILIPFLHRLKFGQCIREEGPSWHRAKSGTPTMGGISFIVSVVLAVLAVMFMQYGLRYDLMLPLVTAVAYGAIGFLDDFIKVVKKRNLGLTARQKFLV